MTNPDENSFARALLGKMQRKPALDRVEELRQEAKSWQEKYLQLAEATRKQAERIANQRITEERSAILQDMISVADNLERALAHEPDQAVAQSLYEGVRLSLNSFLRVLENYGVTVISTDGPFDPTQHEAIAVIPSTDHPAGSIVRVERSGYRMGERVLQPAQVIIAAEKDS